MAAARAELYDIAERRVRLNRNAGDIIVATKHASEKQPGEDDVGGRSVAEAFYANYRNTEKQAELARVFNPRGDRTQSVFAAFFGGRLPDLVPSSARIGDVRAYHKNASVLPAIVAGARGRKRGQRKPASLAIRMLGPACFAPGPRRAACFASQSNDACTPENIETLDCNMRRLAVPASAAEAEDVARFAAYNALDRGSRVVLQLARARMAGTNGMTTMTILSPYLLNRFLLPLAYSNIDGENVTPSHGKIADIVIGGDVSHAYDNAVRDPGGVIRAEGISRWYAKMFARMATEILYAYQSMDAELRGRGMGDRTVHDSSLFMIPLSHPPDSEASALYDAGRKKFMGIHAAPGGERSTMDLWGVILSPSYALTKKYGVSRTWPQMIGPVGPRVLSQFSSPFRDDEGRLMASLGRHATRPRPERAFLSGCRLWSRACRHVIAAFIELDGVLSSFGTGPMPGGALYSLSEQETRALGTMFAIMDAKYIRDPELLYAAVDAQFWASPYGKAMPKNDDEARTLHARFVVHSALLELLVDDKAERGKLSSYVDPSPQTVERRLSSLYALRVQRLRCAEAWDRMLGFAEPSSEVELPSIMPPTAPGVALQSVMADLGGDVDYPPLIGRAQHPPAAAPEIVPRPPAAAPENVPRLPAAAPRPPAVVPENVPQTSAMGGETSSQPEVVFHEEEEPHTA